MLSRNKCVPEFTVTLSSFYRHSQVAFIPLTVILTITAIKDLVEDLKRWRSDVNINKQMAEVYNK